MVPPVVGLVRRGHDTLVQLLLLMLCPYITNTFVTAGRVHTVPLKLSVFLLLIISGTLLVGAMLQQQSLISGYAKEAVCVVWSQLTRLLLHIIHNE